MTPIYNPRKIMAIVRRYEKLNGATDETIKPSTEQRRKHPLLITLLALWLMFSVLGSIVGLMTPMRFVIYPEGVISLWGGIGLFYIVIMLTAAIGYWRMQSWGVYVFAFYILLGIIHQQILKIPATLEYSINQITGSATVTTILTLLYGAIYLIPGYFYIISPRNENK